MTNPTPHGQVPEALRLAHIFDNPLPPEWTDMVAAAAELRRQHTRIAELEAEIAGGVQALSAAPAEVQSPWSRALEIRMAQGWKLKGDRIPLLYTDTINGEGVGRVDLWLCTTKALAASPTPPAEQQAPKETLGGVNGWRDISTAPKDGSRFVATGHNYGLYSEVRHTCVAQWFRGCWMEASDWNETSELKYLTHWMPLPSPPDDVAAPAEQQAAPKAAPGEPDGFGSAEHWKEKVQYWAGVAHRLRGEALRGEPVDGIVHPPAPQQEAQEPCPSCRNSDIYACTCTFPTSRNAAPQPAPAPLIARSLAEWHEQDGNVAWWAWNGREWAGEPAWIGTPNCEDWPGYHTHWTPHPEQPVFAALAAQRGNK